MTGASCAIVGTGPSAKTLPDLTGADCVIAVNGAIDLLEHADWWFTMDPSRWNRAIIERGPRVGVRYFVSWPPEWHTPGWVQRLQRRVASRDPRLMPAQVDSPAWWMWRWGAHPTLAEEPGAIASGNSAYGALNLAYQAGFTRVALFGVDATQDRNVGATVRPYNLSHLPLLFRSAVPQLKRAGVTVINGSPRSRVDCFTRTTPQRAAQWITGRSAYL